MRLVPSRLSHGVDADAPPSASPLASPDFKLFRSLYALVQKLPSALPPSRLRISPLSSSSPSPSAKSPPPGQLPVDFFSPNPPPSAPSLAIPPPSELQNPAIKAGGQKIRIYKHEDFLAAFGAADVDRTQVKDGTNVMLKWYQNASFLF